jgi:hypothetical protein
MASEYGLNFGFLRSSEEVRWAEGRFRIPAGAAWMIGTAVEVDPATPGFLKVAAAAAAPVPSYCGILLQELEWERSIYESSVDMMDSFHYGVAKPNRLAIITGGAGVKVWFRNTPGSTRADGRVIGARTIVAGVGALTVGSWLQWNGTQWAAVGAATDPRPAGAHMRVMGVNAATTPRSAGYVEAVLVA